LTGREGEVGERLSLLSFLPFLSSPVHPENPVILSSSGFQEEGESDRITGKQDRQDKKGKQERGGKKYRLGQLWTKGEIGGTRW